MGSQKGVRGEHGVEEFGAVESFGVDDANEVHDILAGLESQPVVVSKLPHVFGYLQDGEILRTGDCIRITPDSPAYLVRYVNESRALCTLIQEKGRTRTSAPIVNIGPRSTVLRVDPVSIGGGIIDNPTTKESNTMSTAATIPVASKSTRQQEKERKQSRAAKLAVKPNGAAGLARITKVRPEKAPKVVKACLCGCGDETTAYFTPGHDARFKGLMIKVERGVIPPSDLPKLVQKTYEFKKKGAGYVATTNYKGEKHSGYDLKGPPAPKAPKALAAVAVPVKKAKAAK